jgi:predicted PhzF superfamily epimerase YddE/YHI9
MSGTLYRYTAFSEVTTGGNPAGIWVGDELPPEPEMQRTATGGIVVSGTAVAMEGGA